MKVCSIGAWVALLEDCGGVHGYQELIQHLIRGLTKYIKEFDEGNNLRL